ncbi:MAG TPA: heme-copper oxidase subunit III [Terracidiphilus sp.]|nr:heme-copper oxidase subunit III [Terracidiphilus sp.]
MSTLPTFADETVRMPSRGTVAMVCLIVAESAIFTIFVVAYVYYIGRSTYGPTPQILNVPIFNTICLLSSSLTIVAAEHAIKHGHMRRFAALWALTMALGIEFLVGTGIEWRKMIFEDHLTIRTNLFGTTFYSLVGLHASHVIVGLLMLSLVMIFTLLGYVKQSHAERIQVLALYWHFVDAVWVVVFTVVYIVGR